MDLSQKFEGEAGKDNDHWHVIFLDPNGETQMYPTIFSDGLITTTLSHNSEYAIVYDPTKVNANKAAEFEAAKASAAAKKVKIKTVKAKKGKKAQVKWKKVSGVSGYVVAYSTSKKFTKKTTKTVNVSAKATKKTLKKLKAGKTYYVRVRVYDTLYNSEGAQTKYYSDWSKVKRFKAKK